MKLTNILAVLVTICLTQSAFAATEKKLTTYQRQLNLMKRVNEAEKHKQLSVSEAKAFRKELSKIAVKKQKVRDRNAGKTSPEDMSKVEEQLTKTSEKINERIEHNK